MYSWKAQSLTMKRIWIAVAVVTTVILVHGTYTFRVNHQNAFAQAVEKKIDIASVHVIAKNGTLILQGRASKPQSEYAEEVARMFIARYAKRSINPPDTIKNEIQIGSVVTQAKTPGSGRQLASYGPATKTRKR